MDAQIDKINTAIGDVAEQIHEYVRLKRAVWRTVPYWTLQSCGREEYGWGNTLAFTHRLFSLEHDIFIECYSAEIVNKNLDLEMAPDNVIATFLKHPERFDADAVVAELRRRASSDARPTDDSSRIRDNSLRKELRKRCLVRQNCDILAFPLWMEVPIH